MNTASEYPSSQTPRSSISSISYKPAAPQKSLRMTLATPRQSTTTSNNLAPPTSSFRTPQKTPPPQLVSTNMPQLYEDESRLYLKSVDMVIDTERWTVKVGDLACVQIERMDCAANSTTNTNTNNNTTDATNNNHDNQDGNDNNSNKHAPFKTDHQPIQILSIYQNVKLSTGKKNKKRKRFNSNVFVEIRYFYRCSDLDGCCRERWCCNDDNNNDNGDGGGGQCNEGGDSKEEVLESDHVEVVHASFLLGCLVLNSPHFNCHDGHTTTSTTANNDGDNENSKRASSAPVPTVTMNYNHQFYLHQHCDILQFNHPMQNTLNAMLLRGIKSSRVLAENEEVLLKTCEFLNLTLVNNNHSNNNESGNGSGMEQIVVLPRPALTLEQQQKQEHPQEDGGGASNGHEKATHYYPSCQLQYTTSPTIHPYESLPINWNVCVGDVVAVKCDDHGTLSPIENGLESGNNIEWYPYRVPWAHAQITSIYRHVDTAKTSKGEGRDCSAAATTATATTVAASKVQYDVRLFPRLSECANECQDDPVSLKHLPASNESHPSEEIFEGNQEKVGLDFTTLLGPIQIVEHDGRRCDDTASSLAAAPFATQIRRIVNSTMCCDEMGHLKQMSPRKQAGNTDGGGLVDRGIEASQLWKIHDSKRDGVYRDAVMQSRKDRDDGVTISMDDVESDSAAASVQFENSSNGNSSQKQVLFNASPTPAPAPLADTASDAPVTSPPKKRRSKRTKTPVSKAETESQPKKRRQPKRGQVTVNDKQVSISAASIRSLLTESPAAAVAGPATAIKARRSKRGKSPIAKAELEPKSKKRKQSSPPSNEVAIQDEEAQDDVITLRVKCTKPPFHVDVSSQKSFYDKINIQPPTDSYDDRFSTNKNDTVQFWTVRLGDMVCIEVEEDQKVGLVTFPFVFTWSPAEIVSIYRVHDDKADCLELREKLQSGDHHLNDTNDNSFDDVMVEVRWFYRKHEIPGAGGKSSFKSQSSDGENLEELFETDHIGSCPAECLLSPIKLYEASRPEESLPSVVSGMPCVYYHCRRYWSIHRKSFIPSGLLSNRIERGRMHSNYKAALSKLTSTSSNSGKKFLEGYSWREGFKSAIQKLSLAEAAADVQVHGMELKCREKERRHIGSFLRKAIRGLDHTFTNTQDGGSEIGDDEGLMNTKSSIFICGPPGTGKTASVRSIINELQDEQASGKLPEFNFIALNGMEMRSPYDSYVKFWEALSGTMKERLSAGAAAAKLEDFFGDDERNYKNEDRSKKPITVLMLDEIDYLVTKKQTILYNFFDWPLRATKARLIVIGISNTINLPERLSLKLQSRLGGERCHFKSYTVDETVAILKTRLDGDVSQVFDEDAIKFASRKTGNLSGDIRKAFQMCKVAAQNALDDYASGRRRIVEGTHPKVKISDVQRGSRDMYTSIIHKAISCSSSYEALVLIAIGALKKAKVGKDIASLDVQEMLTKIESIANGSGEERYLSARLSLGDLMGILSRLGDAGILSLTTPKHSSTPWPLIQTSLEPYEINSSYRNTPHSKLAEKHLAEQRLF